MPKRVSATTSSAYFTEDASIDGIRGVRSSKEDNYWNFVNRFGESLYKNNVGELVSMTQSPRSVAVIDGGHPLSAFYSKVQKYIRDLSETWVLQRAKRGFTYLNHCYLVQNLVSLIVEPSDLNVKTRAQHILVSIEKKDSSVGPLNHEIARYLDPKIGELDRKKTFKRLKAFGSNPLKSLMLPFPVMPCVPKNSSAFASILPKNSIVNPLKNRHVHDAFWQIEELIVGYDAECYLDNLKGIGSKENFMVIDSHKFSHLPDITWLRDPLLILENKKVLVPSVVHTNFFSGYFEELIRLIYGRHFRGDVMGQVYHENFSERLLEFSIPGLKEAPFYFEGGNLIPAINQSGEKVYLCGANNILYSIANSRYLFSELKEKKNLIEQIKSLEKTPLFSKENLSFVQERLEEAIALREFSTTQKEWIAKLTIACSKYIEKQMTNSLGHPVIVIGEVFKAPIAFHLDMFLLAAPEGLIFVQDFELCKTTLHHILQHVELSMNEKKRLRMYAEQADLHQKMHGQQLKAVEEILKNAGFKVVLVPGIYYDRSGAQIVNLINSIVGSGKKGRFCISNGSLHPVDRHLRDAFTCILHAHGIDRVYFAGKKSEKDVWEPLSCSTYFKAYDGLEKGGGVHCRTLEMNRLHKKINFAEVKRSFKTENRSYQVVVEGSLPKFYREMLQLAGQT